MEELETVTTLGTNSSENNFHSPTPTMVQKIEYGSGLGLEKNSQGTYTFVHPKAILITKV